MQCRELHRRHRLYYEMPSKCNSNKGRECRAQLVSVGSLQALCTFAFRLVNSKPLASRLSLVFSRRISREGRGYRRAGSALSHKGGYPGQMARKNKRTRSNCVFHGESMTSHRYGLRLVRFLSNGYHSSQEAPQHKGYFTTYDIAYRLLLCIR